ncbi:DinB/UmuC family translesion DNA polymerase [Paenibacillus kandeliae]|uniref:Y-family DNA polymerase n=1 Tax=Paenibacillus kandeliae TaxID=3231269 RepID=UPI0034583F85
MQIDYSKLPHYKILCVDLKSFYASVEAVEMGLDPLHDMVAVVGDITRRGGVVLAASPALKERYGIQTGSRLYQIPPDDRIHIAKARMGLYLEKSMQVTHIYHRFAPLEAIQIYSIDEAWINVTGAENLFGQQGIPATARDIAMMIKRAIYKELGLLAAVGIGPNKFLAKVVLDNYAKKTGLAAIHYPQIKTYLWPLPVQQIWGIGRRMQLHLNRMAIFTLGDIAKAPLRILSKRFGVIGEQLYYHAWGIDHSPVIVDPLAEARKGFSHGITLMRDYRHEEAAVVIYELTDMLARKLRQVHAAAFTISLSLRFSRRHDVPSFSKSTSLYSATNLSQPLYLACMELLLQDQTCAPIRHISVSVSHMVHQDAIQVDLFDGLHHNKLYQLGLTTDRIINEYGMRAIMRAVSLTQAGTWMDRSFKLGGHDE